MELVQHNLLQVTGNTVWLPGFTVKYICHTQEASELSSGLLMCIIESQTIMRPTWQHLHFHLSLITNFAACSSRVGLEMNQILEIESWLLFLPPLISTVLDLKTEKAKFLVP